MDLFDAGRALGSLDIYRSRTRSARMGRVVAIARHPSKHSKAPGKLGTKFVLASGLMSPSKYRWLGPLRETLTDEATNHGKLLCHSKRDGPVGPL